MVQFNKFRTKLSSNDIELFSGFLEKPAVPPSFVQEFFKLAFVGKSGVGKTSLVNLLANHPVQNSTPGETPGIEFIYKRINYIHTIFYSI